MTSRARRLEKKKNSNNKVQNFDLCSIQPITDNQELVFDHYADGVNLFLLGCAGTGKSFISVYLALKEILDMRTKRNRLVIIRNTQSSKDQGFLPGDIKQKAAVFEAPYKAICSDLFHRDDAYEILKQKGVVEFHTTSYLRGTTIDDAIILVDETQNMSYQEIRTVLTRVGDESRIIICGDTKQDDLTSERFKEQSGIYDVMKVFGSMDGIEQVVFNVDDIVRSGFVREFIRTEHELGIV